jgi:hypothetical protein
MGTLFQPVDLFGSGLSGDYSTPAFDTSGSGVSPNLGGGIPLSDPGINVISNGGLLDTIANFASKIGSTSVGVLNNLRFGTGPGGITPVAAQPQGVVGSLGIGGLLLLGIGGYFLFKLARK